MLIKQVIFLLFIWFIGNVAFAMPCPNGNGLLYKGDSPADAVQQCGEPTVKKTTLTDVTTYKRLIYYSRHPYDQGYTQANILFTNDTVTNIHIYEHYTVYMCRQALVQTGSVVTTQTSCGDWDFFTPNTGICSRIFGIGATIGYVKSVCGQPAEEINLPSQQIETTEFIYEGYGQTQKIIFQNGKLVDFK